MREITFYRTAKDRCPVEEFLDTLSDKKVEKILWVLRIIRTHSRVSQQYFKKLIGTDNLWEVRSLFGNDTFRLFGFFDGANLLVLTNGFAKKTQKSPRKEIRLARSRMIDYLERKRNG